jgi:transcription-repair coupling factor (superfamily II helicase)
VTKELYKTLVETQGTLQIGGAPEGYQPMVLADLARLAGERVVYIARDASAAAAMRNMLAFFAPDLAQVHIPAWDCLPFDRLSPQVAVMSERMASLASLAPLEGSPHVVITTVSAAAQRLPARDQISKLSFSLRPGQTLDLEALTAFLSANGYSRCSTVMEPGDYAIRGGIVDLFAPGADDPVRLDLFGDTLESLRPFAAETQRTIGQLHALELTAAGEIHLDEEAIQRFRRGYVQQFGTVMDEDPLYTAISDGVRHQGMEHWLPLFHDTLETLFDHCGTCLYVTDAQIDNAFGDRMAQIDDYYEARKEAREQAINAGGRGGAGRRIIKPLPPEQLYLLEDEWKQRISELRWRPMSGFQHPESDPDKVNLEGREPRNFAAERKQESINLFDTVVAHMQAEQAAGRRMIMVASSRGAQDRLSTLLREHGSDVLPVIETWQELAAGKSGVMAICSMETGFITDTLSVLTEQDILGDRIVRRPGRKKAENFLTEATSLTPGDHVVHVEHGIGRFEGLQTLDVGGAPHDCLRLIYHGDSRLFLPVENIELLSRFGGDDISVTLDKIGGVAWQMRKARLKEKLNIIAGELIKTAAERAMRKGEKLLPEVSLYDEFAARFPFEETDDQMDAIEAVVDDMASGRPMDRLICGDVGFGKTEVGLRAAFVAALAGRQVAIIAPTTLLARQHAKTFRERFSGMPVEIRELSRLIASSDATLTKAGLKSGAIDIVIGTHALLAKNIEFQRLGLVIVDEEQHFGVVHKERLKTLRAEVHMLTLTATPIPRTLQMALTGVRDLSIIATPPVDRLAVRTYVTPFDPVGIREALLREKYRAGQSFIIVPRISDLTEIAEFLEQNVPELKYVMAHGQMAGADLEARMNAFYDGQYDTLLSTSIIESGLDIPSANTIIIHRADMFGLAQLYQMRGRVGRSKTRAYGYLTYNETKGLTENSEKRLKVMQSLDSLGAGFNLASYDLDLRGAGNLVGEEQSGHIKEVGFELYQAMLEEAVADRQGEETDESWSPQINAGISVLIPEPYVPELDLRMGLYRRLSSMTERQDIDAFAAELIDRFGDLPEEVRHLLAVLSIKIDCFSAGIQKIDVGPKGAAVVFRNQTFANPDKLIAYVAEHTERVKIRPDQSLVFRAKCEDADARLQIAATVATRLAELSA